LPGSSSHSARWNQDTELQGRRVGVLGTGSTGVQILTATAEFANQVTLFQRTPQWIFPLPNPRVPKLVKLAYRRLPGLNRIGYRTAAMIFAPFTHAVVTPGWQRTGISWICRRNLASVTDPGLRAKLTPDYPPMCKRLVVSARFYKTIQQPHVRLVTDPIARITESGVVTSDGHKHRLDVLVLATGFDSHAYLRPIELTGRDGLTLDRAWSAGPRAYRGIARIPELLHDDGTAQPRGQLLGCRDCGDPSRTHHRLDHAMARTSIRHDLTHRRRNSTIKLRHARGHAQHDMG
jgi:cation diffusion facilitator CzcD-associated flavoprotein CzcO